MCLAKAWLFANRKQKRLDEQLLLDRTFDIERQCNDHCVQFAGPQHALQYRRLRLHPLYRQTREGLAQLWQHARQQTRRDRGNNAEAQLAPRMDRATAVQ